MTQVNLTQPFDFTLQQAVVISIVGVDNVEVFYSNDNKICKANCNLVASDGEKYDKANIILWEGQAYDDAGQFTDEMVNERLIEVLKN